MTHDNVTDIVERIVRTTVRPTWSWSKNMQSYEKIISNVHGIARGALSAIKGDKS